MNPPGLPGEVEIEGTQDNAGMARSLVVQTAKMRTVHSYDRPSRRSGITENRGIRVSSVALAVFNDSQDVVSQRAQLLDDRQKDVFVRVEPAAG